MVADDLPSRRGSGTAPERAPFEWLIEGTALVGVIVPFLLALYFWPALPAEIPSHFDPAGEPDAWRAKGVLLLLPMVSVVIYSTLSVWSLVPQAFNYPWEVETEREPEKLRIGREMVAVVKAITAWSIAWITWRTIQVGLEEQSGLGELFLPILLLTLGGSISIYMARLYRLSRT